MIQRDMIAKFVNLPGSAGAFLLLDPQSLDPIVQDYLNGRTPNDYMAKTLLDVTVEGANVIDLGCHIGTFAIAAAAAKRNVACVDANAFHVALIEHDARLNGLTNLTATFGAISAEAGFVRFSEEGLFGRIDYQGIVEGTVAVPAITLDAVFATMDGPVTFLKMDIEGAEYDALLTGEVSIHRDKPIIMYESNGPTLELAGRSITEFRHLLERWDYQTFRRQGQAWVYAGPDQIQPEAWVDMVAVHVSKRSVLGDRLEWTWDAADIEATCRTWAALPYPSTRTHLRREIARAGGDTLVLLEIAREVEAREREG